MVGRFASAAAAWMDAGDWKEMVDMTELGLHSRQMFIMTSKVESREMKEAKVYCKSQQTPNIEAKRE